MTITKLIEMLTRDPSIDPDTTIVDIFEVDAGKFMPVTCCVYGPRALSEDHWEPASLTLYSDDQGG